MLSQHHIDYTYKTLYSVKIIVLSEVAIKIQHIGLHTSFHLPDKDTIVLQTHDEEVFCRSPLNVPDGEQVSTGQKHAFPVTQTQEGY